MHSPCCPLREILHFAWLWSLRQAAILRPVSRETGGAESYPAAWMVEKVEFMRHLTACLGQQLRSGVSPVLVLCAVCSETSGGFNGLDHSSLSYSFFG